MASQRLFFEIFLITVAMHFAFAINSRELRKIDLRFNKIETDYHRRISDLELEVQHLQLELDVQRTNGDGMSPESKSHGQPIPAGVTDHIEQLEKALINEREIRVKLQHEHTVMQGQIDKIIAENIVSDLFTKQMSDALRKALKTEKTSIRNLTTSMQQNIKRRLFNISESVSSSVEDIQKIQNSTLKLNMERTEQLNHDLNAIKSIVDSNTAAIFDVNETIMELRDDGADRNTRLQRINNSVEQVEDIQKIQNSTLKLNMERTEKLNHDLNAIKSTVDSNTAASFDVNESIMDLRVDAADRNTRLQRINEAVKQVKSKMEIWEKAAINGVWGLWSSFTECSRPCNGGTQTRRRACDSPAPAGVGDHCPGDADEAQSCNTDPCPVNGVWGLWSSFTECSRPCNGGTQTRRRACDSPAPVGVGDHCPGDAEEAQSCNSDPCLEDCSGITASGVYDIFPSKSQTTPVPVYCDVSSDGAWTVIQKRFDGSVEFRRKWAEYRAGFGNVNGEYWLGNKALHHITSRGNYKLKIVLTDWEGVTKVAEYSNFHIGSESDGYRLTLGDYSGDTGDSMAHNNGNQFTTTDKDNDEYPLANCAEMRGRGGWWYDYCGYANLNGVYHHTPRTTYYTGIYWYHWHDFRYSMKATTMMIRKT